MTTKKLPIPNLGRTQTLPPKKHLKRRLADFEWVEPWTHKKKPKKEKKKTQKKKRKRKISHWRLNPPSIRMGWRGGEALKVCGGGIKEYA